MAIQNNNESPKKTREAQMVGERKKSTRVKNLYNTSDVIRAVLKSCNLEDNDANSRNIRRIVNLMNEITANNKSKLKDEDVFNKVVAITKRIYNNVDLKKLLSKEHSKKNLTVEEYDILINVFVEEINKDKSLEEQRELQRIVESLKGDDLIEEAETLRDYFNKEYTNVINMLLEIDNWESRMKCFNRYKDSFYKLFIKFKEDVEKQKKYNNALMNLIKKEPDLLNSEEWKRGEFSEELKIKLLIEMQLDEIIEEFKEYKERNK